MKKIAVLFFVLFSVLFVSCESENPMIANDVEENNQEILKNETEDQAVLPEEKNEDAVKRLRFTVPEDFSDEPYKEAELIPSENFVWGEYMPFIRYSMESSDDSLPSYAFLGEGINSLYEGHRAFEKLNSLYLTEYTIPDKGAYVDLYPFDREWVADYLFKSNIVKVSEDLKKLQVWRVVDWGKETLHGELDTYENGILTNTEEFNSPYYYSYHWLYSMNDYEMSNLSGVAVSTTWEYTDEIKENWSYEFSVSDNGVNKYSVAFDIPRSYSVFLDNIVNSTTLLLTFVHRRGEEDGFVYGDFDNPYRDNGISRNTYVLDLEKGTLEKVANYLANPWLSPDGEYLIYSSFPDRNAGANPPDNYAYRMSKGFFVKRISTDETTFFPMAADWDTCHATLGWISKTAYNDAVK